MGCPAQACPVASLRHSKASPFTPETVVLTGFCFGHFRYPHGSATSLNSLRKDVNLPNMFQVPNGLSKVLDFFPPLIAKKPIAVLG